MIAAAIVCAAVVSQAATFDWASNDLIYTIDTTKLEKGKTYSVGTSDIDTDSWAVNYILTFTDGNGGSTSFSGALDTDYCGSIAVYGLEEIVPEGGKALIKQTDPTTKLDYSIILTTTVLDGEGVSWTLTSNEITGQWDIPSLGNLTFASDGPTTWSTEAVPEPTSGLLLLLGVAGLALRRRRA